MKENSLSVCCNAPVRFKYRTMKLLRQLCNKGLESGQRNPNWALSKDRYVPVCTNCYKLCDVVVTLE